MSVSQPPSGARQVIVIGAGVGGLAAAIRLLAAGHRVTVLERLSHPGGKMRQVAVGDQLFDGGPSVLTLPWVLDDLCQAAGVDTRDVLTLTPLEPLCRHFFADGTRLDLFNDEPLPGDAAWARSADEISRVIGPKSGEQYRRYRRHAARIYAAVERPFMRSALPSNPLGFLWAYGTSGRPGDLLGLLNLDAHRTLWQALSSFFDDERLRILFARYATYSGADPYAAPATLSVIPHVEQAFGVQAVQGGMYRVAQVLSELVLRLGGKIQLEAAVEHVELDAKEQRALAVIVAGERVAADCIIANCDVAQLYGQLLRGSRRGERLGQKLDALPPSLSAYLNLCVADLSAAPASLPLCHHNVFFSDDYRREFEELATRPPSNPTVYLCNPDAGKATQRWFFLTNAPPLPASGSDAAWKWGAAERAGCRAQVIAQFDRHGIPFTSVVRAEAEVTPGDFADLFPGSRGALYGAAASSRLGAFKRPPNRVPGIDNLFCVGGSTHPGAGVPMVMLSAAIVSAMVQKLLQAG